MNFDAIAYKEYRNFLVFQALAERETNEQFRQILFDLTKLEEEHVRFWTDLSGHNNYLVSPWLIKFYVVLRRILGLTFVMRLLEMQEDAMSESIREWLFETDHPKKKDIETVLLIEEQQELKLIKQIKEERVEFTGSIVLGLNDGLIELSGALTGFAFAFQSNSTVTLAGFILGIAASLSMASSAYLQARHERGKDPKAAAFYTGIAYLIVVILLVAPFLLIPSLYGGLITMFITVLLIVAGSSYYTSVVFNRQFKKAFLEMSAFSIGTASIALIIGIAARTIFGIQI